MAGHSRPKDGVLSHAYVPAIHVFLLREQDVDARHKAKHDGGRIFLLKREPVIRLRRRHEAVAL